jgi:hypothetical protein
MQEGISVYSKLVGLSNIRPKSSKIVGLKIYKGKGEEER